MTVNFLTDKRFLNELDNLTVKEQYIRITVLSWQEDPIQEVQGKVISGSINLNGSSSMRRTGNLTIFAEEYKNDLTQINNLFSINRKIKLELGFKNTLPVYTYDTSDPVTKIIQHHVVNYQDIYGDIVWFPLGIYVIFDPNISHSTTGVQISLNLKDKMCLLNGDAGGTIPAAVNFYEREQENEDGTITVIKPTLRQIIQECVNHFGEESLDNIIIEDLDERVKQVMRYIGDSPIYYVDAAGSQNYYFDYETALQQANGQEKAVTTYEYGDNVGFVYTDFTYPGELVSDIGETVTSVLDKIVSVLGNYEYFYDVYGKFHFQEIKNYLNTTYTSTVLKYNATDENYEIDLSSGKSVYTFEGTKLIDAFTNAPRYSNIKNDFIVWGVRKTGEGVEIPIRYHLAIDTKPSQKTINKHTCYGLHYAEFYTDDFNVIRAKIKDSGQAIYTKDWREELYYQGLEAEGLAQDSNYYFTELINEWPKLYDLKEQTFKESVRKNPSAIDFYLDIIDSVADVGKYSVKNIGRRSTVVSDDKINCVFEDEIPDIIFICKDVNETNLEDIERTLTADQLGEVKRQSAAAAESDRLTVEINLAKEYYLENMRYECDATGQKWIQVDETFYSLLTMGGYQNSCFERIRDMLYQYTNMNNSISITSMPIYYLEPNTRITVEDNASGIYGDYMINSISLPLDISSTMSISASKCLQRI